MHGLYIIIVLTIIITLFIIYSQYPVNPQVSLTKCCLEQQSITTTEPCPLPTHHPSIQSSSACLPRMDSYRHYLRALLWKIQSPYRNQVAAIYNQVLHQPRSHLKGESYSQGTAKVYDCNTAWRRRWDSEGQGTSED